MMTYDNFTLLLFFLVLIIFVVSYNFYLARSYDNSLGHLAKSAWKEKIDRKYQATLIDFLLDGTEKIDKISWNDMEMDSFLNYFDRSFSIAGSQALYKKLHDLNYEQKDKRIVDEILNNKEDATSLGKDFLKYADFKEEDFFDLLIHGSYAENINSMKPFIYTVFFLSLACLPFFFISIGFASICFVLLRLVSIFINIRISKISSAKYKSFVHIRNLAKLHGNVSKTNLKLEGLIDQLDKYKKLAASLKSKLGAFYLKSGTSTDFLYTIFDNIFLYEARLLCRSTKYINENLSSINGLYRELAHIDMYLGLAISLDNIGDKSYVDFNEDFSIKAQDLHNPILYYKDSSVANSFEFKNSVLLTGSNASGKSTFLRSLGANIIIGSSLGFAFAKYFSIPRKNIYSAISIRDSIEENVSYFMAETIAIKRMIENKSSFYILDEIFKGTNTIDRISAALFTLDYLSRQGLVIAASHDIELTRLLENFKNYHFEEMIKNKDIVFDYILKEGPSRTRNAIEILRLENYPSQIVDAAKIFSEKLEKSKSQI